MKAAKVKSYRFATQAQWDSCLFVQVDRETLRKQNQVRPFAPYDRPGVLFGSHGGYAPAITRWGEIFWRDEVGAIHRLTSCDYAPEEFQASRSLERAQRLVPTASGLWVITARPAVVELFEADTLTRLATFKIPDATMVDIASDGDTVWVLIEQKESWHAVQVDARGNELRTIDFKGISKAIGFVFLKRSRRFVVLAGDPCQRLYVFDENGRALFGLQVTALHQCFRADVLGSDSIDRVFLAGVDEDREQRSFVLVLDADGNSVGDVLLDAKDTPVTGIAANSNSLLVTGPRGLTRFSVAADVPVGADHVECTLLTPRLSSPDREDKRRWLRAEAKAILPEGSTLEISWIATDEEAVMPDPLNPLAKDESVPANRVTSVLSEPGVRRGQTVFSGAASTNGKENEEALFTARLFDVKERYLRVCVTLSAAGGASLPVLSELNVIYPGHTLMEDLPSIYQREEDQPDSFLRALVGVLETTTQGLDRRIEAMGSYINPATTTEPWLDFIARWLGVPFDDALTLDQKRAVVMSAAEIAKSRGTRAGLEALLAALLPGSPARYRVKDLTADLGFAVVGGLSVTGSTLPAMLGGYTRWRSELDASAVLGQTRLPCANQLEDGVWQLAGRVQVEVAAKAVERAAWQPWLLALITQMVPLTARVELKWVNKRAFRSGRLDGTMELESPPEPKLGNDAITGLAILPERGVRLSKCGAPIGTRLR
jgi:phage tail-like protein